MRTYDDVVHELDLLLAGVKAIGRAVNMLNSKLDGKRWQIGRLCFEIFGHNKRSKTGLTVAEFARERGSSNSRIYDPLRVYRVLGNWYERQIDPVPFTIARLTVQHRQDVAEAERLIEVWRERGEPDEAEWNGFLSGAKTSKPAEQNPNLSRSRDKAAVIAAFDEFEKRLDAVLACRFFANRFIPAQRAASTADKIDTLNGKRRNLLKIANAAKTQTEPAHEEPAAELVGAGAE